MLRSVYGRERFSDGRVAIGAFALGVAIMLTGVALILSMRENLWLPTMLAFLAGTAESAVAHALFGPAAFFGTALLPFAYGVWYFLLGDQGYGRLGVAATLLPMAVSLGAIVVWLARCAASHLRRVHTARDPGMGDER